jgi:tetratricopeptide (TPR) repeat protein
MIESDSDLSDTLVMFKLLNSQIHRFLFVISAALGGFVCSSTAIAAQVKLPHIEAFEDRAKPGATVIFKTEDGNHFNQQSPLGCGSGSTTKVEQNKLSCTYKKEGEYSTFLAVCDDAGKFCKMFRPTIVVGKSKGAKASAPLQVGKTTLHHGFKLGNPEGVLDENLKSKKPKSVLIDFFALWCPPCNDLDELVFSSTQFQKETKNLAKIKVNVDEEESWNLKEKFKIQGYPTLVYLNSQGEEIGRTWGSPSPEMVISWLKTMRSLEAKPLSWAASQSDEESIKRIVKWNFEIANYEQVKTLTGARSETWAHEYFLRSESSLAELAKDNKKLISNTTMLMKLFPTDVQYGYWELTLAGVDKPQAEKNLTQTISTIDSWMARPNEAMAENVSYQDLLLLKADIFEALDKKEELKKAQLDAIAYFEKELAGGKKISRGRSHILAYFYRETGKVEEAKKIYESLVKDNPQEFTFYYRYARALNDLKEYEKALEWLEKAAPHMTEGNSRLQYSWMKGKILNALGKKADALQIVDGTLAIAKAPTWEKDNANRWIKDLNTLKQEIESPEKEKK